MNAGNQAVFLSYASQDAEAVRRVADALRAAGVEVWFDQNELVGGDAWDAKIRKQIAECALFVPVISVNTQARLEGYFRLEWKLAAQRTHTMADEKKFLLPVVVDETRDREAKIPAEFRAVQWTRLPGGAGSGAFCARVKQLLASEVVPASSRPAEMNVGQVPALKPQDDRRVSRAAWVAGAVALTAIIALVLLWRPAASPSANANADQSKNSSQATRPLVAESVTSQISDKSIAVLPFANMSDDKDNTAFFSDGVQEDILTNLGNIREFRVVSRTSVMGYRDTKKPLPQIARELGVAYVLEGSVRRAGQTVRVTGQLIRAATDTHVWAKAYDRELTNVFSIQSEIAQAIAAELKTALSPEESALVDRRQTEDFAAYELYLRARAMIERGGAIVADTAVLEVVRLLERAVEIDPKFARAWGWLASAHSQLIESSYDKTEARQTQARAAIETAVKLSPDSPETRMALGAFHYANRDYALANEQFEWITQHYPNHAKAWRLLGFVQRRWGHWEEALKLLRRGAELDPANIEGVQNIALHLFSLRRYDEAAAFYRRLGELRPEELENGRLPAGLGTLDYYARGSTAEGDAFFVQRADNERSAPPMIVRRKNWAYLKGDTAEFLRLDATQPFGDDPDLPRWWQAFNAALVLAQTGDIAAARLRVSPFAAELRADLVREPANELKWMGLAMIEAVLGERDAAIRDAEKSAGLLPVEKDAFYGASYRYYLGVVYAWTGNRDRAIAELATQMKTPPGPSAHVIRRSPDWWPLRDDPRFEALLADPKSNAPLF